MLFLKVGVRRARFWWRLSFAYIERYRLRIGLVLLSIVIIIALFTQTYSRVSRSNLLTIGYVGVYTLETIPTSVLSLATQSLVTSDTSGKPVPSLASHWTVSEDGKTYVVFLKDSLKWHDNSDVSAKDLSIAISNVGINALNNKAIEFRLPNPIASFPLALDKPVFKSNTFYGTGEFRIVGIDRRDNIVKRIRLVPKDKNLPRVDIKFYQTEEQAAYALKIGEIKVANVANAKEFESWFNLNLEKNVDLSEIVTIFFDTSAPPFDSKDFRQALAYSINRTDFDGVLATGPISKSNWVYNPDIKRYDYNTGKAKELLSKSEVVNPKVTLTVTPGLANVAQEVKKDWEAIGVKVDLKEEKSVPRDFGALLAVNMLKPDPDQYSLWHSTQKATNITKYKDVKIDKLLEDARSTPDEGSRRDLYFDFQRVLSDNVPAVFLYYPNKYKVAYKNIAALLSKLPRDYSTY